MNKTRNTNYEALRIIAMMLIVLHHFVEHSGIETALANASSVDILWINFLKAGGKIGVNIFALISGYFLIKDKKYKFDKIIKYVFTVLFYSIILTVFYIFFSSAKAITGKDFLRMFYPLYSGKWWYATSYFFLLLIYPYINKLVYSLTKIEYRRLLIILGVTTSILPSILGGGELDMVCR